MNEGSVTIAYLIAGVLFIRSLGGLSKQETSRQGNLFGILGMALAVVMTALVWLGRLPTAASVGTFVMVTALLIGSGIGAVLARRVEMTGMPELVAILHSFVGLAAVLVGYSSFFSPHHGSGEALTVIEKNVYLIELWVGVAVGAVTFTGSVVAWAKLRGSLSGTPMLLPGRHAMNGVAAMLIVAFTLPFLTSSDVASGIPWLIAMTVLASALGVHLVMAIGGADMPVVVSLLNSYSGWAAAAAGFTLANDLLIMTGALVGSSGAILSIIMCRAMNRSILHVVFGGFGTEAGATPTEAIHGTAREMKAEEVARALIESRRVIIVPGYGMAVARAQSAVNALTRALREKNIRVEFAIHPVAGRLPGHMNVLLAEAGVPYDLVHEMEKINPDFPRTDMVLVIGANDIVNPAALEDRSSPIYGMPVLEVWKAGKVIVLKRGMAAGFAGIENPLFFHENTFMLFGDARKSIEALVDSARNPS